MLCVIVCAWVGGNLQELFPARVLRDILVLEYLPSSCGVSGTSPSTTTHMEKEIFFLPLSHGNIILSYVFSYWLCIYTFHISP